MNEDAQWISETLAGNSSAFGLVVKKYQDRLYNTLVHVTGSAQEAEEVAWHSKCRRSNRFSAPSNVPSNSTRFFRLKERGDVLVFRDKKLRNIDFRAHGRLYPWLRAAFKCF